MLNKDTTLCLSLSARPSHFGTRFHNYLYAAMGLNFAYKACTTNDLEGAVRGLKAFNIRGCGVSMPYKEACIPFLDELTESAAAIQSVNTIVNEAGRLIAYNTDYLAVAALLASAGVPKGVRLALHGSGGMAKAVAFALRNEGFAQGTIVARNEAAGRALAEACGYDWAAAPDQVTAQFLINATPIGMAGGPQAGDLPFPDAAIARASHIMEVVAVPVETPFLRAARAAGAGLITGAEIVALQALEQFVLYTGQRPTAAQYEAAAAHARAA